MSAAKLDIKTIGEFLTEQPNVDVSLAWQRCWGIHSGIVERVKQRFAVQKHPSTAGREYYTSLDQSMEGSFAAYTLCRQLLLNLRAEARKSAIGAPLTAALAALLLACHTPRLRR